MGKILTMVHWALVEGKDKESTTWKNLDTSVDAHLSRAREKG